MGKQLYESCAVYVELMQKHCRANALERWQKKMVQMEPWNIQQVSSWDCASVDISHFLKHESDSILPGETLHLLRGPRKVTSPLHSLEERHTCEDHRKSRLFISEHTTALALLWMLQSGLRWRQMTLGKCAPPCFKQPIKTQSLWKFSIRCEIFFSLQAGLTKIS